MFCFVIFICSLFAVPCNSWHSHTHIQGRMQHKSDILRSYRPISLIKSRGRYTFPRTSIELSSEEGRTSVDECEPFDGDGYGCRQNKCFYCCSDDLCHPDETYAPDCILGCTNYCHDGGLCAAQGCIYDDAAGSCHGTVQNRKFSENSCGTALVNDGVWYGTDSIFGNPMIPDSDQKVDTSKPKSRFYCFSNMNIKFNHSPPSVESVFQTQIAYTVSSRSNGFKALIPILEDGDYKLVVRFAEIFGDVTRQMRVILNGIEAYEFNTTVYGLPLQHTEYFTILDDLISIFYKNKIAAASPTSKQFAHWNLKYAEVALEVEAATTVNNYIPVLNAYYVEKIDT